MLDRGRLRDEPGEVVDGDAARAETPGRPGPRGRAAIVVGMPVMRASRKRASIRTIACSRVAPWTTIFASSES